MTTPGILSHVDGTDGDAAAIIEAAVRATIPQELDPETLAHVIVPAGAESKVIDLESHLDNPRRKRGVAEHHTGASLGAYVQEHDEQDGTTRLFADVYARSIVAVLNGHEPRLADADVGAASAGWGDHRARLTLRHTPEWKRWAERDGKLLSQVEFAEHIEDCLDDIHEPTGAELLELAKTFEAKTDIAFRSAVVLESGERQLSYVENIDARAGRAGDIVIPKEFVLGLAPFEGCEPYRIVARLRYRIVDGRLGIGYQLVKAEDVMRAAFADTLTEVENATELTAFRGAALT